jgi:putative ABC transport system permease protein
MARTPNRVLTDAGREIRHTFSRFVSLAVLSALAVCFLAGLRATEPDMKLTADHYLDQQKLMDIRVLSTLGLSQEDVSALAAQDQVAVAQGAYTVDAVLSWGGKDLVVKALSLSEDGALNAPKLVEGRMPQRADECLVEPLLLQETGLSIGDTITLDTGTGSFADALAENVFTIVGTANSPLYIGVERGSSTLGSGKVSAYLMLPQAAFAMDYYTDVYLRLEGAEELMTYSDAYSDLVDGWVEDHEDWADQMAQQRYQTVLDEANQALADAQQELDDARAEVQQELDDAWTKLQDGRSELDSGWNDYRDGQQELKDQVADANAEIADGQRELEDAKQSLDDGQQELTDARQKLDDGWASYHSGLEEYQKGLTDYNEGLQKYLDGEKQYQDGLQQYQSGRAEYQDGAAALASAAKQLKAAQAQYEAGLQQYDAGKAQFDGLMDNLANQLSSATGQVMTGAELLAALQQEAQEAEGQTMGAVTVALQGVLTGMHNSLSAGIAQATEKRDEMQNQLDATEQGAEQLSGAIEQLEQQIAQETEAGNDTADLQSQLEQYKTELAQLQASAAALQSGIDQADGTIGQLESQQAALPASPAVLLTQAQELAAAKAQLDSAWAQLDSGWSQYYDGSAALSEGAGQLRDAKKQLEEAKAELDDAKAQLEDAARQLDEAKVELADAKAELERGEGEYADGQQAWDEGWTEYQDGQRQLEEARETLEREVQDANRRLADALVSLQDGEQEYADGLSEYEDGRQEADEKLADAQRELEDARAEVAEIEPCDWYLLTRNTNAGYLSYAMDAERMGNLATVFPLIFFLVAALVCLTTMTRMVEEQRTAIGGMKALGFSRGAIAIKYVGYGFLASTIGSLVGLVVGLSLLPWIICTAWTILYTVGDIYYSLEPMTSILACVAAIGTVTLAALAACLSTLTEVPAELMRPKAPPAGKRVLLERIGPLWRRLSFNQKITIRNLFRYHKRFWMTVIGIGGCAALIVTAFGLRDSIFDVMDKQYDELYRYTVQIGLENDPEEMEQVADLLDSSPLVQDWQACRLETVTAQSDTYTMDAYLQVFNSQEELERFINLRHRTNDTPVVLPDDGVVMTEKLATTLGLKPGDTFSLDGEKRVTVRLADTTEHYIQHYIYMTAAYYEQVFGVQPEDNLILVDYPVDAEGSEELDAQLVALDGVTSLTRITDTRRTFTASMESVDYAVILIIVCAATLAFVVLFNLTNINITERMRELATLKVLGFYDRELSAYVYRENVILTIFGVALGMGLGKLLHQWLIRTVEIDLLMFGRQIKPQSYLWAILLTVIFSLLVNLAAHWKLKKLDMVESLKSVE